MSEITETILKLGGLINLLILIVQMIDRPEPSEKPLKEHIKDMLKIMASVSAISLGIAFLSNMELLRPISDFMTSDIFINLMISITTAIPILFMLVITINEIDRYNYKQKLFVFVFITSVILTMNVIVYIVLSNGVVGITT